MKKEPLIIRAEDDDLTRAINIFKGSGIAITETTYNSIIPWAARIITGYQKLDRQAWEQEQKDTK